jgi:hypothetical protein
LPVFANQGLSNKTVFSPVIQKAPLHMSYPAKPKAVYIYPLQIWLTSVTIGPILSFLSPGVSDHSGLTPWELYWAELVSGLILFFPSFLLLWAGVAYLNRGTRRVLFKKIVVAGCALVLGIATVSWIIDWSEPILQGENLRFIVGYLGSLLVAVFLFRWPKKVDR